MNRPGIRIYLYEYEYTSISIASESVLHIKRPFSGLLIFWQAMQAVFHQKYEKYKLFNFNDSFESISY